MGERSKSRVAVVTGASRGAGKAITGALLRRGFVVGCIARNPGALDALAEELDPEGGRLLALPCDVQDAGQVSAAFEAVGREWGRLDVLVHNAGAGYWGPISGCSEEAWERAFGTNVKGAFLCAKAALPLMESQASGRIVMISSMAQRAEGALEAPFASSKRALQGFARTLGLELRERDIGVTLIAPGALNTAGFVSAGEKSQPWYGVPALEIARLVTEVIERSRNVWVHQLEVTQLGGESPGPDGEDIRDALRAHEAELLITTRSTPALRPSRLIDPALVEHHELTTPCFEAEVTRDTSKHDLFRALRTGADHLLGRAVLTGDEVGLHPDLLEVVYYGRRHGVESYGVRSTARGFDERFLVRELLRHGLNAWDLLVEDEDAALTAALEALAGLGGAEVVLRGRVGAGGLTDAVELAASLRERFPCVRGFIAELAGGLSAAAAAELREAHPVARGRDLPFWVEGWPACLTPELSGVHAAFPAADAYNTLTRERSPAGGLTKGEACETCALYESCCGYAEALTAKDVARLLSPTGELLGGDEPQAAHEDAEPRAGDEPGLAGEIQERFNEALPEGLALKRVTLRRLPSPEIRGDLEAGGRSVSIQIVPSAPGVNAYTQTRLFSISYAGQSLGKAEQRMIAAFRKVLMPNEERLLELIEGTPEKADG